MASLQGARNWFAKYVELMVSLLRTITPQVGERLHADEVWVKINGNIKYLFAMMGGEMRFVLAQKVLDSKNRHNARSLPKEVQRLPARSPRSSSSTGWTPATCMTNSLLTGAIVTVAWIYITDLDHHMELCHHMRHYAIKNEKTVLLCNYTTSVACSCMIRETQ